jgi:hypothetical protein
MPDQPVARGRLVARDTVKLPVEAFEMRKKIFGTFPLAKPKWNAEAV